MEDVTPRAKVINQALLEEDTRSPNYHIIKTFALSRFYCCFCQVEGSDLTCDVLILILDSIDSQQKNQNLESVAKYQF